MSCVRWQVTQVEGLINDALASKCGVPMQKDGHDLQTGKGEPKSDVVLATMSTRHVGEYVMIHFSKNDVVFIYFWLCWVVAAVWAFLQLQRVGVTF